MTPEEMHEQAQKAIEIAHGLGLTSDAALSSSSLGVTLAAMADVLEQLEAVREENREILRLLRGGRDGGD